jgi:hypothetical protein
MGHPGRREEAAKIISRPLREPDRAHARARCRRLEENVADAIIDGGQPTRQCRNECKILDLGIDVDNDTADPAVAPVHCHSIEHCGMTIAEFVPHVITQVLAVLIRAHGRSRDNRTGSDNRLTRLAGPRGPQGRVAARSCNDPKCLHYLQITSPGGQQAIGWPSKHSDLDRLKNPGTCDAMEPKVPLVAGLGWIVEVARELAGLDLLDT